VSTPVILHLDELVHECGWFDPHAETNNGYGCQHPRVEDRDHETGEGRCMPFACPLAARMYDLDETEQRALREAGVDEDIVRSAASGDSDWMERCDDPVVALPVLQSCSCGVCGVRHPGTRGRP